MSFGSHFSYAFPTQLMLFQLILINENKKIKRGKGQSLEKLENSSKHYKFRHQQLEWRSYPQY